MSLKPLASAGAPDLINFDRDSMVREIMDKMRLMPGWKDIWTAEQYQDASQFVLQVFSFLHEKNIISVNKMVRENLLSEAFSERGVFANLAQLNIKTIQNKESTVELIGRITGEPLVRPLILPLQFPVSGNGLSGAGTTFEIINKVNGEYDYVNNIVIEPGPFVRSAFAVTAYAGETKIIETPVSIYTLENARINIPYEDIIDDSVVIYYRTVSGIMVKLPQTTKFVVEPVVNDYFPNGAPHYIVRYNEFGTATIYFGSTNFGGAFEDDHIDGNIVIYCRVGGGSNSNVVANGISYRTDIDIPGDRVYDVTFTNPAAASGGDDRENFESAKIYGPMRYGRDGTSVLVDDVKLLLYKHLIKHEIETPQYSEISNTIPLLHAFHYIVPTRNLSGWESPEPEIEESATDYITKVFFSLNEFLKVTGTNATPVVNKTITTFVGTDVNDEYNFLYSLGNTKPIGDITVSAFDYEHEVIDQIKWTENYYETEGLICDAPLEHAEIKSKSFSSITITEDENDLLKIKFNNSPYTFEFELPTGQSTIEVFVAFLQDRIKTIIDTDISAKQYFSLYTDFEFFSITEEVIADVTLTAMVIRAPKTGIDSRIEIIAHENIYTVGQDLYNDFLGFNVGIYAPDNETRKVFSDSCAYYYNTGDVSLFINKDGIEAQTKLYTPDSTWDQNTGVEDGPELNLILTDDDPSKLIKILENSDILLEAYYGGEAIDSLTWKLITNSDSATKAISVEDDNIVFDNTKFGEMEYDFNTSAMKIILAKGIGKTRYVQSFNAIGKIVIKDSGDAIVKTLLTNDIKDEAGEVGTWTQDTFSLTGPDTYFDLDLTEGEDYSIEIFNTDDEIICTADVTSVGDGDNNVVLDDDSGGCFTTNGVHTYSFVSAGGTGRLHLQFSDGDIDTVSPPYYENGYSDIDYLKVTFVKKSYSYIGISYIPNPYMPVNEALSYKEILTNKSRNMITLENIIKDITFAPVGGELNVTIGQTYSSYAAQNAVKDKLLSSFKYDNTNGDHTIGELITENKIQASLMQSLAQDYGIQKVEFVPSNNYDTLSNTNYTYFFILDDDMIEKIKTIETDFFSPGNLTDIFEMKINIIINRT